MSRLRRKGPAEGTAATLRMAAAPLNRFSSGIVEETRAGAEGGAALTEGAAEAERTAGSAGTAAAAFVGIELGT